MKTKLPIDLTMTVKFEGIEKDGDYEAVKFTELTNLTTYETWMDAGLRNNITRLKLTPGEIVKVTYRGLKPTKKDPTRNYNHYDFERTTSA